LPNLIRILLIEDNPGDVRLTQEALSEGRLDNEILIARDGEEGLDCVYSRGKFAGYPRPDIILLDLNLPRIDGQEVLRIIKTDSSLRRIPVIVLTTSKAEEDILRAYDLDANAYITKPVDVDEFLKVIRATEDFWLAIVKLPSKESVLREGHSR
jgi:chemotaxis family two-component system response regulator Rcp1